MSKSDDRTRIHSIWQELNETESEESATSDPISEEAFGRITGMLDRYTADAPTAEDSKRLIEALHAARDSSARLRSVPVPGSKTASKNRLGRILHVVMTQVRLFSWTFWLVSAFIVLLGAWSGLFANSGTAHPLLIVVPLLAALSVCVAFRSYGTPMFELEMSLPISPSQLVYGRLLLIIVYDIALALAGLLMFGSFSNGWIVLIADLLVPLGVTVLLALTALLYMKLYAAALVSVFVWTVQLFVNDRLGVFYLLNGSSSDPLWLQSKLTGCIVAAVLGFVMHLKVSRMRLEVRVQG